MTHTHTPGDPERTPAPAEHAAVAAPADRRRALITGASGYVGAALVPALLRDFEVRVLTRSADGIADQSWAAQVETVVGDAGDPSVLAEALGDVDVAYYLIHSMDDGDFAARDRALARAFADASGRAGVGRIVYLGGLHPDGEDLSPHLASRVEIGRILLDGPVPAACLQAALVLGDGSASFEMLRYLTTRLPVMLTPSWIDSPVQPIAAADTVRCLRAAADLPAGVNRTFDIGGPEVLTYRELMATYARIAGLRPRTVLALPVLTPGLASHWVGAVTPLPAALARPLVGSLVHPMVRRENDFDAHLDPPASIGVEDAIRTALATAPLDTGPGNLARSVLGVGAAAAIGSLATRPDSRWYARLAKPAWQPPRAAFPIVWTALYAVIAGVSAAHRTELDREGRGAEATAYGRALGANLTLNALWSALFFRAHALPAAVVDAALLTASSADLARRAGSTSRRRRRLLVPYAAWCAFATALSADIARRNRRTR